MSRKTKNPGRKAFGAPSSLVFGEKDPRTLTADVFGHANNILLRVSGFRYRGVKQVGEEFYNIRFSDVIAPDPSAGSSDFGVALLAGARACQIFTGKRVLTEECWLSKLSSASRYPDIIGVRFMPPYNRAAQIGNASDIFITGEATSGETEQPGNGADGLRAEIIHAVFRAVQEQISARSQAATPAA